MEASNARFRISEDWTSVLIGFLIIGLALSTLFILPAPQYGWSNGGELVNNVFSAANFSLIFNQFAFILLFGVLGARLTGIKVNSFISTLLLLYSITLLAQILAGNAFIKSLNLEAVIFSLILGLLIRQFFNLPEWFTKALSTELFVKIGLVLLGCSVIFSDILKNGTLGLIQSLVVVLSVWYFSYWLCKRWKIDEEMAFMLSSAVSICGVSAAIATAGAINGDSKKLSFVVSVVLIVAIPMMIFMPILANYMGLSQEITGAWLGGTIDTSGAVVASGSMVGEKALEVSTIVKFSQNVLLGIAAFFISVYWTLTGKESEGVKVEKPTLGIIWDRFPKFVLGFLAASLVFSFLLEPDTVKEVKGHLKNIQTLWFGLAFTSIGLETKFSDLFKDGFRKPFWAFLIAQFFNIIITLILAYLLFR
ncbi:YeiH family protein [Haliscomenobacter hydrossis]|uniref:Uncharacterized protein family UPF0324 n=1 Tax=Haliscomenobacter hydrossis (strain ATCC 27775 / DSM 1100 / LMG 10767 / O) TaxID=760192 RepID=F4KTT9_HALH1|nr:putative sulfate exporter family transporter [Haliscomenobacter hydrossis]AEE48083.1 Uncharacterized protein family UPF0324 [Haliscomenobacter hydrossis DSM 1100]